MLCVRPSQTNIKNDTDFRTKTQVHFFPAKQTVTKNNSAPDQVFPRSGVEKQSQLNTLYPLGKECASFICLFCNTMLQICSCADVFLKKRVEEYFVWVLERSGNKTIQNGTSQSALRRPCYQLHQGTR